MKYADHPQQTERHKTGQEEKRQNRQQLDDAVKRSDKLKGCPPLCALREQVFRRPDAQCIFRDENADRHRIHGPEQAVPRVQAVKGHHDHHRNIDDDRGNNHIITDPARHILPVADLDNLENTFLSAHRLLPLQNALQYAAERYSAAHRQGR